LTIEKQLQNNWGFFFGFVKTKLSLYTSAKASVLGAAWSLLPSCADDLDAAWNLPRYWC
jgi:hypothetical protein